MVAEPERKTSYNYRIVFRKVRKPVVEYEPGQMIIVLPKSPGERQSLEKYADWMERVHANVEKLVEIARRQELVERSQEEFRHMIWDMAEQYSKELGVDFYKIFFKRMNKKWASCGSDGNLTINTLMKRLPEPLIRYIVYHEMTHRIEQNHGPNFWRIVTRKFPDRKRIDLYLFVYWLVLERVA